MKVANGKPGTSMENKTGGWRTEKPVVDQEKCIKCGQCQINCPDGCIFVTQKGAQPNYDYCKGCGICAQVCPVKCIKMVQEQK